MANDPHRDLLPVREDCSRSGKGFSDKFDHQILGKLSRCELEDRFLRLLDEQTHIKKLANCQEEKIKRLGTKLLRLINEKKNVKKLLDHSKETEDLHLRIIELEHENYTLKDKNTVLKQQLSSHSRHLTAHRSPLRSNHTSPLMTTRQSVPQPQSECTCEATNKNTASEMQLQEAENHIKGLNEEIKSLHIKIDFLEQNLEKSNLDSRRIKVSENIELIRLQRSLKQQAIQIAALQEQIKNSEKCQKSLKEELIKAHNENDNALQLISLKQSEILSLCSKLEEKNLNRLEEDELKERINDLVVERDCLKERSEFLMKKIAAKAEESEKIQELQKLLAEEKCEKEKLEVAIEMLKNNCKSSATKMFESEPSEKNEAVCREQQTSPCKKEMNNFACNTHDESESSRSQESLPVSESDSEAETSETHVGRIIIKKKRSAGGKCVVEKMKLELELQYLRDMLRSQTLRCEAQQAEISRLMYELKLNENKCNETLQRLDWHLRIFESLEMRAHQNELIFTKTPEPTYEKVGRLERVEHAERAEQAHSKVDTSESPVRAERLDSVEKPERPYKSDNFELSERFNNSNAEVRSWEEDREEKVKKLERFEPSKTKFGTTKDSPPSYTSRPTAKKSSSTDRSYTSDITVHNIRKKDSNSDDNFPSNLLTREMSAMPENDKSKQNKDKNSSKRFVDNVFLESSEEDLNEVPTLERESFTKKFEKTDETVSREKIRPFKQDLRIQYGRRASTVRKVESSGHSLDRKSSDSSFPSKPYERDYKKETSKRLLDGSSDNFRNVTITIFWFKAIPDSALLRNDEVEMFFIDFSFLDLNGPETETPQSVPKPRVPEKKCEFNFSQTVTLNENRVKVLQNALKNPDVVVLLFKLVSDSEKFDSTNGECEDFGIASVKAIQFFEYCNKGPFTIQVKSSENTKEIIGLLSVSVEASHKLLNILGGRT